jgi:hypothetical protein
MARRRIYDRQRHAHFITFGCYLRRRLLDHPALRDALILMGEPVGVPLEWIFRRAANNVSASYLLCCAHGHFPGSG